MSLELTHAMILAAGLGTRLRPLTHEKPKPLIPVAGKPMIDYCLDWLQEGGVHNVVINSSYMAEQLEAHVGKRAVISREGSPPLETGGGVAKALPLLGNKPFLVMNCDAILTSAAFHPIRQLCEAWHESMDFLMLLVPRGQAVGYFGKGDFLMDERRRVRRPAVGEEAEYIFSGVELIHPRVFTNHPQGPFSLNALWRKALDDEGYYSRVRGLRHCGAWINVGDHDGLRAAEVYLR